MLGKPEVIGIDVGQYSVKLARIKQTSKSITITHLTYETIPAEVRDQRDKEALSKIVMSALKKQKMSKGTPVLHVNFSDVVMRTITLDSALEGNALEGRVELELAQAIPFPIENVYFDFDDKVGKDGVCVAAAVRRDIADDKVALLKGLPKSFDDPQVDIDSLAIARLMGYVSKIDGLEDSVVAVVDIGYSRSRFYFCKGSELLFTREQQIGGKQVNDIIMDMFDVTDDVAENRKITNDFSRTDYDDLVLSPYLNTFVEQVRLASDFFEASGEHGKEPVKALYMIGGGSRLFRLSERLNEELGYEVKLLNLSMYIKGKLIDALDSKDGLLQTGINHALAIGLAIEG